MKHIETRVPVDIDKYQPEIKSIPVSYLLYGGGIIAIFAVCYWLCSYFEMHDLFRITISLFLASPLMILGFVPYKGLTAVEAIPLFIRFFKEPKEFGKHSIPPQDVLDLINNQNKASEVNDDVTSS